MLNVDIDAKFFTALVKGLTQVLYHILPTEVNEEDLYEELFSGTGATRPEVVEICEYVKRTLQVAAANHWDAAEVQKHLDAENQIPEQYRPLIGKQWSKDREAVHTVLANDSIWGKRLKYINWRVDTVHNTNIEAANEDAEAEDDQRDPVMLVEIASQHQKLGKDVGEQSLAQFVVDGEGISRLLGQLKSIESRITANL